MVDQAAPGEELPEPPAGATQRLRSELIGRPKCPRHPDTTSSRGCATCGSPICQRCANEIKGKDTWLCPQCFADAEEEMAAQARQSAGLRRSILIVVVAAAAIALAVIFLK